MRRGSPRRRRVPDDSTATGFWSSAPVVVCGVARRRRVDLAQRRRGLSRLSYGSLTPTRRGPARQLGAERARVETGRSTTRPSCSGRPGARPTRRRSAQDVLVPGSASSPGNGHRRPRRRTSPVGSFSAAADSHRRPRRRAAVEQALRQRGPQLRCGLGRRSPAVRVSRRLGQVIRDGPDVGGAAQRVSCASWSACSTSSSQTSRPPMRKAATRPIADARLGRRTPVARGASIRCSDRRPAGQHVEQVVPGTICAFVGCDDMPFAVQLSCAWIRRPSGGRLVDARQQNSAQSRTPDPQRGRHSPEHKRGVCAAHETAVPWFRRPSLSGASGLGMSSHPNRPPPVGNDHELAESLAAPPPLTRTGWRSDSARTPSPYRDLDEQSSRSPACRPPGVGPGTPVGVMLPNVPEFAPVYYGVCAPARWSCR